MKIEQLKQIIRESLREMIEEEGLSEVISGVGAGMSGRVAGPGAGIGGAGGGAVSGEDRRWKEQVTALAKKGIGGDEKALANALIMTKDSKPGTYGKEVYDYLTAHKQKQVKAAPAQLSEAAAEARLRTMIREILKEEMSAKKGK